MPTLYLLRHAKSSWADRSLADHDRPLAARGERAAPAMGRYMRDEGLTPDLVVCSTAARTRATWSLMAPLLGGAGPVDFREVLYGASARGLLGQVNGLPDAAERALLVGHNPGMRSLALALAGADPAGELARLRRKFPTAALAVLTCDAPRWSAVRPGACRLERFVRPKDLPDADARGL